MILFLIYFFRVINNTQIVCKSETISKNDIVLTKISIVTMNLIKCRNLEELRNELESMEKVSFTDAIKAKCYECSAFQISEVRACQIKDCPLWIFKDKRRKKNQEKTQTK